MNAHLKFELQRKAKRKKERKETKTAKIEIGFIFTLNRFYMHALHSHYKMYILL